MPDVCLQSIRPSISTVTKTTIPTPTPGGDGGTRVRLVVRLVTCVASASCAITPSRANPLMMSSYQPIAQHTDGAAYLKGAYRFHFFATGWQQAVAKSKQAEPYIKQQHSSSSIMMMIATRISGVCLCLSVCLCTSKQRGVGKEQAGGLLGCTSATQQHTMQLASRQHTTVCMAFGIWHLALRGEV
jgi:hypothetical protein